jgi:glycerophosphoryl diester phosphodiesterase
VTGQRTKRADARCCTSDITLAQFKTLEGKMDAADRDALTVEQFLGGTANWRTDLYATGATLLSHAESIALFRDLGAKYTPELKAPSVAMPFMGFTQEAYAQKLIDEYKAAGVRPREVFAQSFFPDDVFYWIDNEPAFGRQAVLLDGRSVPDLAADPPPLAEFQAFHARGVNIIAPPIPVLVTLDGGDEIVPSTYAGRARAAGLEIITWSLERSGRIVEEVLEGRGSAFYYQTILDGLANDGDILVTLDVLAQDVGIIGIFSDWPATVTYYANCMGLEGGGDDEEDDDD